jgi:ribosomal protein S18 acetylase RimI-like enzyme
MKDSDMMGTSAAAEDDLVVRPARAEDREAVLAFCAQTWSDGDYIPYVWDAWLQDARGALLVAVLAGRPVGVVHTRMIADDEAWLEGIRVDPAVRQQGIGRVLTSRALAAAHERGAAVARLFTAQTNVASKQMIAKFGFARVAEMLRYEAPALEELSGDAAGNPGEPDAPESPVREATEAVEQREDMLLGARLMIAGEEDFERIWEWLIHSNLRPFNGGLEFEDWSALALSEPSLRRALTNGQVHLLEEWQTIQALALIEEVAAREDEPGELRVRYMDGASEGIGRLALVLREEAGQRGLARVGMWLPNLLILRDAMSGAGFGSDADEVMEVYARELS